MAVSSTTMKKVYLCDGTSTEFVYPFKIWEEGDLTAYLFTIADSTTITLRLDVDYTVTDEGEEAGGHIDLIVEVDGDSIFEAAPSSDYKLVLMRELDLTQPVDYAASGPFPAETHEKALDRLTFLIQQLDEKVNRCFLRDITQTGEIIADLDADWYILTRINLNDGYLAGDLNFQGYKIDNITGIEDEDNDTGVYVEQAEDEDKVRFKTGGTQRGQFDANGFKLASGADIDEISIDGTLAGNSDDAVPTEKAVKTYADTKVAASEKSTTAVEGKIPVMGASGYMPDSSVDTTALKTTTVELSKTNGDFSQQTVTGGQYAFWPKIKMSTTNTSSNWYVGQLRAQTNLVGWTDYVHNVAMNGGEAGYTIYATWTYVTASGTDYWLFLLVDKITKEIISSSFAQDHPAYGNGGDFDKMPHPFGSYDETKHEIILVDQDTIAELKAQVTEEKSLLTLVNELYKPNMIKEEVYKPLYSGKYLTQDGKQVKELVTTLPNFIKVRKLIKMTSVELVAKAQKRELARQKEDQDKIKKEQDRQSAINKLKAIGLTKDEIEAIVK